MQLPDLALVQMARAGDIINILPLARHLSAKFNILFVCQEQYRPILDRVSYATWCRPPSDDIAETIRWAKQSFPVCVVSQVDQNPETEILCHNFQEESYRLAGYQHLYRVLPLVFDRRSAEAEKSLIDRIDWPAHKPVVAYNLHGISSNWKGASIFAQSLTQNQAYHWLDLSKIKAASIIDLLAIIERCAAVVSIDTATLHLAKACQTPAIDLVNDCNTSFWYMSDSGPNCICRLRYSEALSSFDRVWSALDWAKRRQIQPSTIWHAVNVFHSKNPETQRRDQLAAQTWQKLYQTGFWKPAHSKMEDYSRSSADLNDDRSLPYIKDVVNYALRQAQLDDIICLSNNDTCINPTAIPVMLEKVKTYGCAFSRRHDFQRLNQPLTHKEIKYGQPYPGIDLFVFSVRWWLSYQNQYPDMLLGCEAWDYVLSVMMGYCGETDFQYGCYHEMHDSHWLKVRDSSAGQIHNQRLAYQWFSARKHAAANDFVHSMHSLPRHSEGEAPRTAALMLDLPLITRNAPPVDPGQTHHRARTFLKT